MPGFGEVKYRSLAETVGRSLREAIISGRLKPGDRVVEQKLAGAFGISQPTVREALKELEFQGFVRKVSNKGTYVTKLSPEDIQKISEVRFALEMLAVEKAAARELEKESVAELKSLIASMRRAVKKKDLTEFHYADLKFHSAIWKLSGNEYLEKVLERLVFSLFAFVLSQQERAAFSDAVRQHEVILDGLLSGDPAEAKKAYLEATSEFWRKHYGVVFSYEGWD